MGIGFEHIPVRMVFFYMSTKVSRKFHDLCKTKRTKLFTHEVPKRRYLVVPRWLKFGSD